ncbi:MAG: hypothetical protein JW908_06280 [Anaerolineales bacterium]|nr:hypothetical protein [Anaerolineales bacterium]
MGHIGKLALELNLPEISKEVCRCFFIQISTIISNIIIEPYQYYLVSKIFENIKILVNYACNKNIDNSIDLNWVLYFNNKVPTKSVAKLIIENFSFIVMELCKIGSLDIVGITFFAQSSIDIASSYPELSLSIISFFGKVISNLTKQNEKYKEITKVSIVNDIMERIDQLERIGLRSENKDIIQKSVKTIKRKTSIFLKNKKTIPCDNE